MQKTGNTSDYRHSVSEFVLNVAATAKVICRQGHGLKSHPTDWRSPGSKSGPPGYKVSGLSTTAPHIAIVS